MESSDGPPCPPEGLRIKHTAEFRSSVGGRPLRLIVREKTVQRMGSHKIGRSTFIFDIEPTSVVTATTSPTSEFLPDEGLAPTTAAAESSSLPSATRAPTQPREGSRGSDATPGGRDSDQIVFVHDRYNGHKELWVNGDMVYIVRKECTDGTMNSWVASLSFGRVKLALVVKLFCFEYTMTLADSELVLFKGKS